MFHKCASIPSCTVIDYAQKALTDFVDLTRMVDPSSLLEVGFKVKGKGIEATLNLMKEVATVPTLAAGFRAAEVFREGYYKSLGADFLIDDCFLGIEALPFKIIGQDPSTWTDDDKKALAGFQSNMLRSISSDDQSVKLLAELGLPPDYFTSHNIYQPSDLEMTYHTIEKGQFLTIASLFITSRVGELVAPLTELKHYFDARHLKEVSVIGANYSFADVYNLDVFAKHFSSADPYTVDFSDVRKQTYYGTEIPRYTDSGHYQFEDKVDKQVIDYSSFVLERAAISDGDLRFPCAPEIARSYDAHYKIDYQFPPTCYAKNSDLRYTPNRTQNLLMEVMAANTNAFSDVLISISDGGWTLHIMRLFTLFTDRRAKQHLANVLASNFIITETIDGKEQPVYPEIASLYTFPTRIVVDYNLAQQNVKDDFLSVSGSRFKIYSIKHFPKIKNMTEGGFILHPFTGWDITNGMTCHMLSNDFMNIIVAVFNSAFLQSLDKEGKYVEGYTLIQKALTINITASNADVFTEHFQACDKMYQFPVKLPGQFPRVRSISRRLAAAPSRIFTTYVFGIEQQFQKIRSVRYLQAVGLFLTKEEWLEILSSDEISLRTLEVKPAEGHLVTITPKEEYQQAHTDHKKSDESVDTSSKGPAANRSDNSANVLKELHMDEKGTRLPDKNEKALENPNVQSPEVQNSQDTLDPNVKANQADTASEDLMNNKKIDDTKLPE
jgi:hypothetical protein